MIGEDWGQEVAEGKSMITQSGLEGEPQRTTLSNLSARDKNNREKKSVSKEVKITSFFKTYPILSKNNEMEGGEKYPLKSNRVGCLQT